MAALTARVVEICDRALATLPPGDDRERVAAVRARMVEPLRVAVAGRVSAGKSTLVNALLAERVTPTAAGETTQVVAWFRYGFPERAEILFRDGRREPIALDKGALPEDLGVDSAQVGRVTVWLSDQTLEAMTVIDTPGLASVSENLSESTQELLGVHSQAAVGEADAIIYVTTHRARGDDAAVLASFRSQSGGAQASAMNAVAVLNKADMAGGTDSDPLATAGEIAEASARELRPFVTAALPIAALWAETALASLTDADAHELRRLAALDGEARKRLLRSVAAFGRAEAEVSPPDRERLLGLLGLAGVNRCLRWIDEGADSAAALSERLERASGIGALRSQLAEVFARRADALKADMGVGSLLRLSYSPEAAGTPAMADLRDELDDVRLDPEMHALNEAWAVRAAPEAELPPGLLDDLQTVCLGDSVESRLGLSPGEETGSLERAAAEGASRWRAFVNGGRATAAQARIGDVACRTYEALWEQVASSGTR